MIISEKQIMQLINIAENILNHLCFNHTKYQKVVAQLIDEINNQQSEELRDVK